MSVADDSSDTAVVVVERFNSIFGVTPSLVMLMPFGVYHVATVTFNAPPLAKLTNSCTLPLPNDFCPSIVAIFDLLMRQPISRLH